jgi:unsaturated rhamnogalacturonyl hydrolase
MTTMATKTMNRRKFFKTAGITTAGVWSMNSTVARVAPQAFSTALERDAVLKAMAAAAGWQLEHPSAHPPYDWTQAAFYTGMMALSEVSENTKYYDAMKAMAERNQWRPGLRPGHADDYAVIATYAKIYQRERDPKLLAPALALFNFLVTRKYDEPLVWGNSIETREWAWCDALFMAPPALAAVTAATGDRKYLDLANRLWWKTTDYLYDKEERLYYRDSRYFEQREPNGRKVFWSRGNGWVFAGLARLLHDMPEDYPERGRLTGLFKDMAEKIASIQGQDGYWPSSLLDPASLPNPETSGTGFFTFGFAWGINHGLLDRGRCEPTVRRGWGAMISALHPDGMLGWVQQIGAAPGSATKESTEVYGTGALLLAGSEISKSTKLASAVKP